MLFNLNIMIDDLDKEISYLKTQGYKIFGTDVINGKKPKYEESKHALIIGSEASGVRDSIKNMVNMNGSSSYDSVNSVFNKSHVVIFFGAKN